MSVGARDQLWGGWPSAWSPTTRLCALAIADVVNDMHGNRFFASVEALAVKAGCTERAARYAIRALEEGGAIRLLEHRPGRTSVYLWTWGADPAPHTPADPAPRGADPAPHRGADPAPEQKKPKMNRAPLPVDNPQAPSSRFPTNRTADRADCSLCADTGWSTNEHGHAFRCTHPAFATAGQAITSPAAAARRLRQIIDQRAGAAPCPDPTTSSPT